MKTKSQTYQQLQILPEYNTKAKTGFQKSWVLPSSGADTTNTN